MSGRKVCDIRHHDPFARTSTEKHVRVCCKSYADADADADAADGLTTVVVEFNAVMRQNHVFR